MCQFDMYICFWLPIEEEYGEDTNVYLWPNQPLICCETGRKTVTIN
jgi:hypothetical protein